MYLGIDSRKLFSNAKISLAFRSFLGLKRAKLQAMIPVYAKISLTANLGFPHMAPRNQTSVCKASV